jgi:predicted transposase/invertase (TIGR01784 family)
MKINRKNKDRLFRFIFGDAEHKDRALELYNALNGTAYQDPAALELTMTEGMLYLSMRNDVSFLLDTEMNLWEHQSTNNPNMPLRGLFYFAQQYNRYVQEEDLNLFGSTRLTLPTPRYYVFYNGDQYLEDEGELHFTDLVNKPELSSIEITARVLNINAGHNQALMEASRYLREYAELIRRLKEACKGKKTSEEIMATVTHVVEQCIADGILAEILKQNKGEVIEMFFTEYDEKETLRRLARDERQEGRKEGLQEGRQEGRMEGRKEERIELLSQLTEEGLITEEIGAQKAGMELGDYRKAMDEYRKKAASRVSDNTRKLE